MKPGLRSVLMMLTGMFTLTFVQHSLKAQCSGNGSFTYSVDSVAKSVTLTRSVSSGNFTGWMIGNRYYNTASNPDTYVIGDGVFNITMMYDSLCYDSLSTKTVRIGNHCYYGAYAIVNRVGAYGVSISVSDNRYSHYSVYWGDGNHSNTRSNGIPHTYTSEGSYLIGLKLTDSANACSDSMLQQACVINFVASATYEKDSAGGGVVSFTTNKSNLSTSHIQWYIDASSYNTKTVRHWFSYKGTYRAMVYLADSLYGCYDTDTIVFRKNQCRINTDHYISKDDYYRTAVLTPTYNKTGIGSVNVKTTINWGDGQTSTETTTVSSASASFAHYYTTKGNYLITYVLEDRDLSCSDTATIDVEFDDACRPRYLKVWDSLSPFTVTIYNTSGGGGPNVSYIWDFGDGDTSHANFPSHNYAGLGPYLLCLTQISDSCTSTYCDTLLFDSTGRMKRGKYSISLIVIDQHAGLQRAEYADHVSVYPNPASSLLTFDAASGTMRSVQIVNMLGQEIFTVDCNDTKLLLDCSAFPPGVYLVRVSMANGGTVVSKIIKE